MNKLSPVVTVMGNISCLHGELYRYNSGMKEAL